MQCLSCLSLSGERRISPGPAIYEGMCWIVDHAYPSRMKGWLVIVLKRHAEALHELSREELTELADLQLRTARLLHTELDCEKEYVMCIAEGEGFHRMHVHVVAKPRDLAAELRGPRIFALVTPEGEEALPAAGDIVPPEELRAFCERLRERFV
jgi:diadenosine tetraphosphate (Ap4A) HIT family hydrolase